MGIKGELAKIFVKKILRLKVEERFLSINIQLLNEHLLF